LLVVLGATATFQAVPGDTPPPLIKCYSDVTQLGDSATMPDVRNTTFSVAVVLENVEGLYGFDIQFNWTTQWIHYLDYTVTVPVDTYSNPISPSPYAGILYKSVMKLAEEIDEANHIAGAESGAMAWIGYSSMHPAGIFNGSGTFCLFTFNVTDQPYDFEAPSGVTVKIHFVSTALSSKAGLPIGHSSEDFEITLYPRKFTYPPVPMIKVTPSFVTDKEVNDTFTMDVWLQGSGDTDLDPFWDVAGIDFFLNFNSTYLEAIDAKIDPDGDFGAFWSEGIFQLMKQLEPGYVHIAFMGFGETHTPVNGTIRIAEITFNVTYLPDAYPHPIEPIYFETPLYPSIWYIMDANGGIIDLSSPVTTEWTAIFPQNVYPISFNLTDWLDLDGDGQLSVGDQIIMLNTATSKWHDYKVDAVTGTLQLEMQPFQANEELLVMDGPTHKYSPWKKTADGTNPKVWDGYGNPYWTGNFSLTYPVYSVNYIEVRPQIGEPYNLTEGVNFRVNPDGTIELLTPLDENVTNEFVGTMPDVDLGWPALTYIASSIQSVYIIMPNGTERYAYNSGYHSDIEDPKTQPMPEGGEWWYDPDFPYELESWWATGYVPGDWTWPNGTQIYVNYTAPAFIYIDYNAPPDPLPYFMEWTGLYNDFLVLTDPFNTTWHQISPTFCKMWNVTEWDDIDSSGDLSIGDMLIMQVDTMVRPYIVRDISTDIKVIQLPCVQDKVPGDPFYTEPIIVNIAGFPHPERNMSPWYGGDYAVALPHTVENSAFEAIPEFSNFYVIFVALASIVAIAAKKIRKK
jgi:hypothetical protein